MIHHTIVYNDNISVSEELEVHTIDTFRKLDKFIGNENVDFRTTYSKEGNSFKVHSHGVHNGVQVDAHVVNDDMYKGVDLTVAKLEAQLRKEKGKRTNIDRDTGVDSEETEEEIEE